MTRRQVFVRFMSPGTLFAEERELPIESADVKTACRMAGEIVERHGARPYGFLFITRIVADPIPDGEGGTLKVESREVSRSGTHYLDGELVRFEAAEGDILRSNMRGNRWPICCETRNGYLHMGVFHEGDCIVRASTGEIVMRGTDPDLMAYRAEKIAQWESER